MANNVTITEGTGKTVATDDVGNVHYQLVKLVNGTEDASDRIAGEATNGLDVDVTRVIPGTSATHLGKAEDAAHSSGDTGVMMLGVRKDTAAALAGTDGDYAPVEIDANGNLYVTLASGANTVGTVTVGTQPARVRTTDSISVAQSTDAIMNNTTVLTPKFATISASSSGNNTIVTAVSSKKIRVLAVTLVAAGTVNVKFQSGAGGTDITGLMNFIANTGVHMTYCPVGHFETAVTTLLNLNLSASIAVGGCITYVEV